MPIDGERSGARTGRLEMVDGRCVLRFERRLPHPVEKVWRAITEPEHLARWYPMSRELEPRVGGKVREGELPGDGDGEPLGFGTVLAYDPPRLLEYTLSTENVRMAGFGDVQSLRFELSPDAQGCRLVFVHVFDDRPGAASYASGWQVCLDALEAVAGERPIPEFAGWTERHERYVERFGLGEGAVRESADGWVVRFERQLMGHPVEDVWGLLTEAEPAGETAGGEPAGETATGVDAVTGAVPAVGGTPPLRFTNGYVPATQVTAVEAPVLLEYGWRSPGGTDHGDGLPGGGEGGARTRGGAGTEPARGACGRVRWELAGGPGGARITLTQTVPRRLADHRPTALAAWHIQLELLARHLEGDGPCWPEGRTEELRAYYTGRLT
jgi:uncharacterized protein YndB with AHSA1/START domain